MMIAACVLTGAAVFLVALTLMTSSAKTTYTVKGQEQIRYDDELRLRLKADDQIYARFGKLVEEIAGIVRSQVDTEFLKKLDHALDVSGKAPPWRADQFIACKYIEGVFAGCAVGGIALLPTGSILVAVVIGLILSFAYASMSVYALIGEADVRARRISSRMSFATDLMALVLQAGGTPVEAFDAVVKENANHPLGEEFGFVATQTRMGRLRSEALRSFRDRYPDPDIADFVFAIVKGEELGTPLALVLNMQATQMRLKHSQWCEKQAAEAGVKMTFPSLLVMLACICVILGPLLLPVIFGMLR